MDKKISEKTCQEINEQDEHVVNLQQSSKHEENETLRFLTSQQLSQHELCVLQIMQEHFMIVKSGNANGTMYTAPILLITGSPRTEKSWLTKITTN